MPFLCFLPRQNTNLKLVCALLRQISILLLYVFISIKIYMTMCFKICIRDVLLNASFCSLLFHLRYLWALFMMTLLPPSSSILISSIPLHDYTILLHSMSLSIILPLKDVLLPFFHKYNQDYRECPQVLLYMSKGLPRLRMLIFNSLR